MKIVQIAPLEESVPPKAYGGTELIVYNLIEEMVKLGHDVYLIGTGDSKTSAKLIPVIPKALRNTYGPDEIDSWRDFLKIYHIPTILKMIDEIQPDIVHNHYSWRITQFSSFINCPMYSTIHGPITSLHERYTFENYKNENYVSISNNQRLALPDINWVKTIYNGIDTTAFKPKFKNKQDYFAFLGRTSPEKGLKEICQMIKTTNHKLKIAAKIDSTDEKYFNTEIRPLIDGKQIEFIGEVNHPQKVELLRNAKGLLLWLNWEEPFGLVIIEAMACGTPVIVNPRGSMPEIVEDKKTGFLVNSLDEMKIKLDDIQTLSPEYCVKSVEEKFSSLKMAKEYLQLAGKLTN